MESNNEMKMEGGDVSKCRKCENRQDTMMITIHANLEILMVKVRESVQ